MDYMNIALAKGRLASETMDLLREIGIQFNGWSENSRKLIFEEPVQKLKVVLVKANDVPTYVEKGAADMGIVGKDTLLEKEADVYEIMDLGFGKCKFSVAGLNQIQSTSYHKLTVASKYPKVAKDYFYKKGIAVDTIYLSGSVELAPLMGLSDVIVDIVETGRTLKENGLRVIEDITDISARLIVNKASFKTKSHRIHRLVEDMKHVLATKGEEDHDEAYQS
ncbi:ATP phosphoribosyltransferase catalytic subunit [Melghiribacillus thermohalophilus]|uniref:ATP phosphoribosyltransferase n=1 Tax=Melghiribacillus thermohalophilus TaxID=1324956 RepID=A0A4R3N8I4_9BACI|nr:ATP phosphoribosyltransferase [Melghiribacillus thermohalophilus]TCT25488.1 ATP phosphoribosyltransferase catalytic subunit [Melghiribacillus thermohalophilus]